MSLKRKNKPSAEPSLDSSNKRFSTYSFSELRIPAMPVIEADYEAEVEQKLTEMTLGGSGKCDGASAAMEAALESSAGKTINSCNYIDRGELLCERLETVPEFKIPAPPKLMIPKSSSLQECLSRPAPVPSTAGVLPPPPSVTQQRLYRRSLSAALPHYCSLERRPRPGQRSQVWMVRSQSFTDVCGHAAHQPDGQQEEGVVVDDSVGRPPLRGGGRLEDRERRNSIRKSMRAISGSWRNLLKQVGGMNRQQKPAVIRKVAPPTVPELSGTNRHSGGSFSSGYGSYGQPDNRSSCGDDHLLPPHSPLELPPSPGHDSVSSSMYTGASRLSSASSGHSPGPGTGYTSFSFPTSQAPRGMAPPQAGGHGLPTVVTNSGKEFVPHFHNHLYQHQQSDDQGIDVQSPGRDSPSSAGSTSSFGCRNSTSSLDSGRASSAYDSKTSHPPSLNRLSGQSYESGGSYRQSYHSSSSSLGSLEKDDVISHLNVAAMLADGMKDCEVLNAWLTDFHFEEYYQLFVSAGYDMPTVSRMTPEDLTAIGITKPAVRRKLKAEIARLNISDGLPDFIPESMERWLHLLRLGDYSELLKAQGYTTVQQATEITWEDLEEIGISRLGHQKRITLAIKRAKDILTGKRIPSQYQHQYTTQEIAITANASPTEPTYQQFKTFHHSGGPPQHPQPGGGAAGGHHPGGWSEAGGAGAPGRFQGFSQYRPLPLQQVQVQVESSAGGMGDEPPPPPAPQTQLQYFEQQRYIMQPWRRSYEDGDLTPTNEPTQQHQQQTVVDVSAAGTLPRQRAQQVRPRPVAKIVAKTREEPIITGSDSDPPPKGYGSLPRDPLKRAEHLSRPPPAFSTPQGTPKKPVPAPPRRDSLRAAEQLAAARQAFPPPPLPLVVRDGGDTSDTSDCEGGSPATCRAGRTDSSASFKSTSSTESDSFPFANDNAGTIKQRAQRPQTAGEVTTSLPVKPTAKLANAPGGGGGQGDVLNDIGSMLADLTDELDAMLELESDVK